MCYVKTALALFYLSFVVAIPAAYAQSGVTAKSVLKSCKDNGSVATVEKLYENGEKGFQIVLDGISSGDADWIWTSACLSHGAHYSGIATASLSLDLAWAEALPKNARAILDLESSGVSLSRVCSIPFIEPEREFFEAYYKAAVGALDKVSEDYLQMDKAACKLRLKAVHDLPWSEPD